METKYLQVESISDKAIDGYGKWIRKEMQELFCTFPDLSFWKNLGLTNHSSTSFGLVESHSRDEMVSTTFEQHLKTTETLIPTENEIILVLAKPDRNDKSILIFHRYGLFACVWERP